MYYCMLYSMGIFFQCTCTRMDIISWYYMYRMEYAKNIFSALLQVHKLILRANKKRKTRQGKRSAMPAENGARARHVAADIEDADLRAIGAVRTAISGAGPRLF